jgi:large subunit ribosomal protein L9
MEVILLERIARLGNLGEVVNVRAGYARNFLLPRGKALRATKENLDYIEREKAQLEAASAHTRGEADEIATGLEGQRFVILRQAGESGQLYGSVAARDVAQAATERGFPVTRQQVVIDRPIKERGLHDVRIVLHPELAVTVTVNVAQTEDEAEAQAARGLKAGEEGAAAPAPAPAPEEIPDLEAGPSAEALEAALEHVPEPAEGEGEGAGEEETKTAE